MKITLTSLAITLVLLTTSITKSQTQSQEVGTLPGSFSVSPGGSATYGIPIEIPPGRKGMTPSIAFVYNSQSPSNVMGQGWGLSGFSSIGRVNPTKYYNDEIDNVDFDDDQLMLDGNRLVEIGTENGNTIYRTEIDEISKIVFHQLEDRSYFIVYNKTGLIKEYGNTSDSRQVYGHDDRYPLFWHLNKVYDLHGNMVEYLYHKIPEAGEVVPQKIRYTLYEENGTVNTDGAIEIEFIYETLPPNLWKEYYYEKDGQVYKNRNSRKLINVKVKDANNGNGILKEYTLNYHSETSTAGEYFLENISLVAKDPETGLMKEYYPTVFEWDFYEPARDVLSNSIEDFETGRWSGYFLGRMDMTGDGRDEIVEYKETYVSDAIDPIKKLHIHQVSPVREIVIDINSEMDVLTGADLNNDGKDELVAGGGDSLWIYSFSKSGSSWSANPNPYYYPGSNLIPYTGDFSGDGLIDLLIVSEFEGKAKLMIGTGNSNDYFENDESPVIFDFSVNNDLENIVSVNDFNGDGKTDFALQTRTNIYEDSEIVSIKYDIYIYSYDERNEIFQYFTKLEISQDYNDTFNDIIQFADFNADGKTDVFHWQKRKGEFDFHPDTITTYISFGKGFTLGKTEAHNLDFNASLFTVDQNNDGRTDLVYIQPLSDSGQYIKTETFLTGPDGLFYDSEEVISYVSNEYNYEGDLTTFCFADISGNGIPDLTTGFRKETGEHPDFHYILNLFFLTDNEAPAANVITGITNGMDVKREVTYQPSRNSFKSFTEYSYPFAQLRNKTWLVDETYIVDGDINKLGHTEYQFINPLVALNGKGSLGYEQLFVVNHQNNTRTATTFKVFTKTIGNDDLYYHMYPDTTRTYYPADSPDNVINETVNSFDVKNTIQGEDLLYLPVITSSVSKTWDIDEGRSFIKTVKTIQSVADIDEYGNGLKSTRLTDEGQPASDAGYKYTTVVESYFTGNRDLINWIVNRPDSVIITKKFRDETDDKSTTEFDYYPNGQTGWPLLRHKTHIPNNNTALATKKQFEYDKYGNAEKVTLSAPEFTFHDRNLEERVTEIDYETTGNSYARFPTQITNEINGTAFSSVISYDGLTGNAAVKTSPDLLNTNYSYDAFGRTKTIDHPDGTSSHQLIDWAVNNPLQLNVEDAKYFIYSYKKDKNGTDEKMKSLVFYDKFGRVIRTVGFGLDGETIYSDRKYNAKGLLLDVSEPYFAGIPAQQKTTYGYDDLGRVVSMSLPNGNVIGTAYSGRRVKSTNQYTAIEKRQISNALGQTSSITDPAGTIIYKYYSSGNVKEINALGATTTMTYNDAGQQATLTEPNTGQVTYIYNPFGELMEQTDARQNTYRMMYDQLGRITEKKLVNDSITTSYIYNDAPLAQDSTGAGFGKLSHMSIGNGQDDFVYLYDYDELNRLTWRAEHHRDISNGILVFTENYSYNPITGMPDSHTFPSGYTVGYDYASNGMLRKVKDATGNVLWENKGVNQRGQITGYDLGNGLSTQKKYDANGFLTDIITGNVQHLGYKFDPVTANLLYRTDSIYNLTENFTYDNLLKSSLASWQVNGEQLYQIAYSNNGNINTKTGITSESLAAGLYQYNSGRPHAVSDITNATTDYTISNPSQEVEYTAFNKVSLIGQELHIDELEIMYGPDELRKITKLYNRPNGVQRVLKQTKHFVFGNYEEEVDALGNRRKLHYLHGGDGLFAIYVKNGLTDTTYYVHKDHLGSYETITDDNGVVKDKLSFDPWGRRRNPLTWKLESSPWSNLFDRGFTGHEHLDKFNLINMNGRVYDSWVGRFLSPDIIVQAPGYSQSYNRYSYVFNNPLKYIDPTGYEGGPNGNPPPYAYGEGSAMPGMGFYGFNAMPWGQTRFRNSGSNMPGSGNHWSDRNRGEWGNYMLMKGNTFNGTYGAGATDIAGHIIANPGAFNDWLNGDLSIAKVREDGGFWVESSRVNNISFDTGDGSVQLTEVEKISKWVEVAQAGGADGWVFGQSIDITFATPGGGYNIEGGWFLGDNGKQGSQFVSHGVAYGVEASVGWNFIFIKPQSNYKFGDLEGMGAGWTVNLWIFSISTFGNSSPGYPENSIFDTYQGFKIGIGAGIGGSATPNSNTIYQNWMPESLQNINWLNLHWH